jgi:hypothetical protein
MSSPFQQKFSAKSPLNQDKKIYGDYTFNLEKDENSGNFVAGLGFDDSADPRHTKDRLVITPEQKSSMSENVEIFSDDTGREEEWIESSYPMTVKKDSVSGGKTYYGLKQPKKTKK